MFLSYKKRAALTSNPLSRKIFHLAEEKKTNLILALDETKSQTILEITDQLGPEICLLKTHIDIVQDFSWNLIEGLKKLAQKHDFLIFEDRKFADIGNTVKLQYSQGIYRIRDWADLVNCHLLPGAGIIEGLQEAAREIEEERGLILLAQMSSQGNLATDEYIKKNLKLAERYPDFVVGFIGNGGDLEELKKLVKISPPQFIIMTPGIKIGEVKDSLGQQYSTPRQAIRAGADLLIVGRGIYQSSNPLEMAEQYRQEAWEAYLKKLK